MHVQSKMGNITKIAAPQDSGFRNINEAVMKQIASLLYENFTKVVSDVKEFTGDLFEAYPQELSVALFMIAPHMMYCTYVDESADPGEYINAINRLNIQHMPVPMGVMGMDLPDGVAPSN